MVLKTGEITKQDFWWTYDTSIGWALIAPHVVLQLSHLDARGVIGDEVFQQRTEFHCDLVWFKSPLGPEYFDGDHHGRFGIPWSYIDIPRRIDPVGGALAWDKIIKIIAYGRRSKLKKQEPPAIRFLQP